VYWTYSNLLARTRLLINAPAQFQEADADLLARLNDFYQTRFPVRVKPDDLSTTYRFQTVGAYQVQTGDGVTKTWTGVLSTVPGVCGVGFSDSVETFKSDENGILWGTYGGLGTISYQTGAYVLTFHTASASGAQIGVYYDTYTLPDNVLTVSAPAVVAGYPLSLVEDVETFWSHWPMYQPYYMGGAAPPIYMPNIPQECLNYDGRLTMRPVPDQPYLFESASVLKPAAISPTSNILRDIWGPYIAIETAYEWLLEMGDEESASELIVQREQALGDVLSVEISKRMNQRAKGRW